MHLKGLNLNLLVVLDALFTERSTTRAGQRIYLSQSATSGALAQLREFFGDDLLVLSGQKMVLTPLAESLVEPVREIIETAEGLIDKTSAFDPAKSTRTFVVNISDASAMIFLANSLPKIREQAPRVNLEIVTHNENIPDVIEQGEVDFIEVPDLLASPFHPSDLLFEDSYVCIAWTGNKYIKDTLSVEQFSSLGHVTVKMLRRKDHLANLLLRDSSVKPRFNVVVPVFTVIPHAVVGTDLIALINMRLATHFAQSLPIRVFPCPVKVEPLRMLLQWNKYRHQDEGTQWLKKFLVSAFNVPLNGAQRP